ncbi:MAG: Spo0E family sporulation regulatory protein-aspartic acid phosphatase [Oscillospiraceae bacterium]|nr:Spo0E family sporulation regulatory protein-aspartic acid phosphatase [Oscillospiraceae bacterium]
MVEPLKKELNDMIEKGYPYETILKKSQELDKYIAIEFKEMNDNKTSNVGE